MLNKIINIGFPSAANVFEVGLFTGQFGFQDFGNDELSCSDCIEFSFFDFYVCYGLECAVTIRVGNERTYGLCEIAARGAIHIFIILLRQCSLYLSFHQYLPQVFVNVNDMRHVVETK
jgi:MATE family multidrug resistance protein